MIGGIPAAEVSIEPELIRALLTDQHPDLASLPLADAGGGWDNNLYRLGENLAVRLPRRAAAASLIEHEQRWLPELASRLPLPIPVPLRIGRPGRGFPWSWSVIAWLPGRPAMIAPPDDPALAAVELGAFVAALHRPAADDAPSNSLRGVPLASRTETVYERVSQLEGILDGAAVLALWNRLAETPRWSGSPLWVHGDLHPGNLLVNGGRLSAVIDFGDLTAGDPATDFSIAWTLLPPPARSIFRLRLSGILATLEVRTQQAITEKLSYVDFLERLVEDEVERRAQKQLQLRLRRAAVDLGKTLEQFDFSFNPSINRQQIFDLATCRFVERHETVLIQGPAGVGKSQLAQALGHEACRRGFDVVFVSAARMLGHLHGGRADGTYERRLLTYTRSDVLVLDDFGLKPLPAAGPEDFYEVINERYERGALIITSNRAFTEWPDLFQSPLLASAALDRLAHHAHQIVITGDSFRAKGRRREGRTE